MSLIVLRNVEDRRFQNLLSEFKLSQRNFFAITVFLKIKKMTTNNKTGKRIKKQTNIQNKNKKETQ